MSAVGFDVGNENSYVAAVISGGVEILDNEYSLRATPSYVAFTDVSRDVGIGAKVKLVTNLENTVFGFKRILGKKYSDAGILKELEYLPHQTVQLPNSDVGLKVRYLKNDVVFSAVQIMAMMLTKLKMVIENKARTKIRDCVISVPVCYTDAQRRAMLSAAQIADLNPLGLINESIAVALAHGFYKTGLSEECPQNIIFIDIGSSAVTVTASALYKEKLKILGTVWDNVGGRDFDGVLVKYFVDEFKDKYKIHVTSNKKALMTLMLECESLKRQMSVNPQELRIHLECFMNDLDVNGNMKRDIFEKLSVPILTRIEKTFHTILAKTKLTIDDINSVEIVGGSTRIPAVKKLIHKIFGREPSCTLNQDEAVAKGCALQCALLSPALKTRDFIIEDVPPYDIQVLWENMESREEVLDVFSGTDKIPAYKMITFCMSKSFTFHVFQIDRLTLERIKLGSFTVADFPLNIESGYSKVNAKVCLNNNGVFNVISTKLVVRNVETEAIALPSKGQDIVTEDENVDTTSQAPTSVKTYELSVTADVPELSQRELSEFHEAERVMISRYIAEKQRADARNALEEYIYEVRSKLNCEMKEYIQDKDRNKLLEYLHEQETWLYDNEEQDSSEFSNRIAESERLLEPLFRRYQEWEQMPGVVTEYQNTLQKSLDLIEEIVSSEKIDAHHGEVESLQKMYQEAKQFLDKSISSFSSLKKCEDASLTTDYLRKCLGKFQSDFEKNYHNLKNKVKNSKEHVELSGDGNSDKEEK